MQDRAKSILRTGFWLYAGLFLWGWLREWVQPFIAILPFIACLSLCVIRFRTERGTRPELPVLVLLILMHLQYCLIQPIRIKGESMEPTLPAGTIVWVNKLSAGLIAPPLLPRLQSSGFHRLARWTAIQKNSIIVIRFPGLDDGADAVLVKRLAAMPGDRFEFRDSRIFVNDLPLTTAAGTELAIAAQPRRIQPPVFRMESGVEELGSLAVWAAANGLPVRGVVPEGSVIVVGDHTSESRDSRSFGFVPMEYIMGTISNPGIASAQ